MRRYILIALLPLAACATPQERCIANASKEIRVLSGLIATTQANLARGYGIRTENFFENELQVCGMVEGEEVFCEVAVADSREVPFALDLDVEAAKLASLQTRRSEMTQRAHAVIAECRVQFPQT